MNKFSLFFVCGGTVILALSIVMGWLGIPYMIRGQIKKNARLIKNRDRYNAWRGVTTMAGITKFYIFNVTNPDQVKDGGKVMVAQVGPYTYEEKKFKVDIGPGLRNHSFEYRNRQLLHFHPEMSTGSEQDMVTFVNIPVLIFQQLITGLDDSTEIFKGANAKLEEVGESLFKFGTVRDFLFDGIPIEAYLDLLQVQESNETKIPEQFLDGKYGLFEDRNRTERVLYEINSGEHNYEDFARMEARNNETLLPWWKNETCNRMNGTDGAYFPPFVTADTVLTIYNADICRQETMAFDTLTEFRGVPGLRFKPDLKVYLGIERNPANWCFCEDGEEEEAEAEKTCRQDGIVSISACATVPAPFSMSMPHFYGAEPSLLQAVDGLQPKVEEHLTFLDIEPQTGKVLKSVKRFQLNVDLAPSKQIRMLSNVQEMAFPVLWVEETQEISKKHMRFFAQIKYISETTVNSRWYMVAGSTICVGIGIIVGMLRRDKIQHQPMK